MIKLVENINGKMCIRNASAMAELWENNCTMPDVSHVIYNLGKKAYPKLDADGKRIKIPGTGVDGKPVKFEMAEPVDVLATTVFFIDNTKISVVNSVHDGLELEEKVMEDGSIVKIASHRSKEIGFLYAIVKRMFSKPNPEKPGKMKCDGFGRMMAETVNTAYDQVIAKAENRIAKAKSKAEHERRIREAKPKRKRYSIAETLERMNKYMDQLDDGKPGDGGLIAGFKAVLNSICKK